MIFHSQLVHWPVWLQRLGLQKRALSFGRPGAVSKATGDTVGRALGALTLQPVMSGGALYDPAKNRGAHEDIADLIESANPEELEGTKIRLGGGNLVDDMRRVWNSPRNTGVGKAIGSVYTPLSSVVGSMLRAPNYNPWADTVTQYWDTPAITGHELGHAISDNRHQGITRDLHAMMGLLPGLRLVNEMEASHYSHEALKRALRNNRHKLHRLENDRTRVIPVGLAAGLGSAASLGNKASLLPILSVLAAKPVAMALAAHRESNQRQERHEEYERRKARQAAAAGG